MVQFHDSQVIHGRLIAGIRRTVEQEVPQKRGSKQVGTVVRNVVTEEWYVFDENLDKINQQPLSRAEAITKAKELKKQDEIRRLQGV